MRYLMTGFGNEEIWGSLDPDTFRRMVGAVDAFNTELQASGEMISADGLAATATAFRARAGADPVVEDGGYVEADEFPGTFSILEVASHERALEIVRAYPCLRPEFGMGGGVELRPFM